MTKETLDNLKHNYPEVVARMIWHQANQGLTQECSTRIDSKDKTVAFSWSKTSEGISFWSKVMNGRTFNPIIVSYHLGDNIKILRRNKPKDYVFFKWDFNALAVWCMTESAWKKFHEGTGEKFRQFIMKLPIKDVVFKIREP